LYARGGALFAAPFDLQRLEVTGAAVPIIEDVAMSTQFGAAAFDASANGTLAYLPSSHEPLRSHVVALDRTRRPEPLLETDALIKEVAPSPDGTRIALNLGAANDAIWLFDIARDPDAPVVQRWRFTRAGVDAGQPVRDARRLSSNRGCLRRRRWQRTIGDALHFGSRHCVLHMVTIRP